MMVIIIQLADKAGKIIFLYQPGVTMFKFDVGKSNSIIFCTI